MGASFNPPHNGHRQIISSLLEKQISDEVWLVPAKLHAFSKSLIEARHRLTMLQLLLEDFSGYPVRIEEYEMQKDGVSYSYETLAHFADQQPENTFAWIIGSDNLTNFHKWYKYLELLQRFNVHVYPRPGYPMEPLYQGMVPLIGDKELAVSPTSATSVRSSIKEGKDITGLVGEKVAKYINDNKLYQD